MTIPIQVLILEDRPADAELVLHELRRSDFEPVWQRVETEADYLAHLDPALDLILADYSLPQFDGLRALALLKERGLDVPFILVSGSIGEELAVEAMRQGAADYLLKDRLARLGPAVAHALEEKRVRVERQRAEAARRESEARFRSLVETATDAIITIGPDGAIVTFNQAAERIFGYAAAEMVGRNVDVIIPEEYEQRYRAATRRYLKTGQPTILGKTVQLDGLRKGGATFPLELSLSEVRAGGGVAFTGIIRDITARVQAEAEIKRRSEELALLLDVSQSLAAAPLRTEKIAALITRRFLEITGIEECSLDLLDPREGTLRVVADCFMADGRIRQNEDWVGRVIRVSDFPAAARVMETLQPLVVQASDPEADAAELAVMQENGVATLAIIPLAVKGEAIGTIELESSGEEHRYTPEELNLALTLANQAAQALENVRLYEAERERTAELARANRFLTALGQVAARMEAAPDPDGVMETLGAELGQLGLACFVAVLDPDSLDLVIRYLSARPGLLARMEKYTGLRVSDWRIPRAHLPGYADVFEHGTARFFPEALPAAPVMLPELPGAVAERVARLLGVVPGIQGVLLPLRVEEQVIGALGMWGEDLHEADLPAATVFANQVAGAIERARLFARIRRRASELGALAEVSAALRTAPTRAEMLPVILDQLLEILPVDGAALAMRDPASGETVIELGRGDWAHWAGERLQPGEGISGRVLATGQPYVSMNVQSDPHVVRLDLLGEVSSVACVPLVAQEQITGVLGVGGQRPITAAEVRLLAAVGDMAASAIQRASLHEQTEQRLRRLTALHDVDTAITASLDLHVTLHTLLDQLTSQLDVDAAAVLLLHRHTRTLKYAAGRGFRSGAVTRTRLHLDEGYAGRAAFERRLVSVPDLAEAGDFVRAQLLALEGFRAYYGAPLVAKGQVKGVLEIFHRAPLSPDPEWLEFLETLATQAAIAIENAQLFDDLQHSNLELSMAYNATLEGWAHALELRDKETEGHTRRVAEMTLRLARAIGMSEVDQAHMYRGALLHDMGKMGIPDRILHKPGPLADEEWEVMHRHPVYAYEMLSPIAYLHPALDIPYCHHEKWDGTGYPRGLKGEQIPLAARVFAVADVWDALRSDRPYRDAWPEDRVLEYIRSQAGAHFDPQVVEIFLSVMGVSYVV